MSQTFSGTLLLGVIVLFIIALFVLGLLIKPKLNRPNKNSKAGQTQAAKQKDKQKTAKPKFRSKVGHFKQSNEQLMALEKRVTALFPELTATVKERHLVLERGTKKVAMLTLDPKAALGRRKLGDVEVINFHDVPSNEALKIELNGV